MTEEDGGIHLLNGGEPAAPLVVLVHGMEDRWETWRVLAGHLDPRWRVVALDLPWRAGNTYRWRQQGTPAVWLGRTLARLGEGPEAIVGHSFGANALLELLAGPEAPGIRHAVLIAPFYRPQGLPITWKLFDRSRRNFEQIISEGLRARLGVRNASIDDDLLEIMTAKTGRDRIGPLGFMALFEQFAATAHLPLRSLAVPALVLGGTQDPSLSHGRAEALAAQAPSMTVTLRDDLAHFCHVQQPGVVAEAVRQFVGGVPQPGPIANAGERQ